jgi:signal transduction histidine kinase
MELEPVVDDGQIKVSRLLATLPVQLIVPPAFAEPAPLSPIRISLVVAWACLLLAAAAVAVLLQGVMTLSERRAAFVSAVTHELRTPLTTFRMYAEMLRDGMVPDGLQRQQYLETLHAEANRLSHLVENVLSYARLERSRPNRRRDAVTIEALLDRVQSRLEDRARQAEMQLVVEADETARAVAVRTDPAAVEQILFNLVDNACKYAASSGDPRIHLQIKPAARCVEVCISDHGPGINGRQAKRLFQPFCKSATDAANSAPGVGLGLALARRLAHDLGGRLQFQPNPSAGAAFALVLPRAT